MLGLETIVSYKSGELKEDYHDFFQKYHPLYGPYGYCETLANLKRKNSDLMQVHFPTLSWQEHPIPVVKLSIKNRTNAPVFLVTGMIHSREFISGEVCLGVLESLIDDYRYGTPKLLEEAVWYFLPVVNPDGFAHNINLIKAGKRFGSLQRKNKRGIDLNRNFPDNFEQRAWTTRFKPSPEYAGTSPFSEPETQFVKKIVEYIRPRAAINFHSFSNALLYPPWSSQEENKYMQLLALRMSTAMLKPYAVVQGSQFLEYAVSEPTFPLLGKLAATIRHPTIEGSLDGWLYSRGIPSMLMEISKPSLVLATVSDLAGFNPPPSELGFHKKNCYQAALQLFKDILYGF